MPFVLLDLISLGLLLSVSQMRRLRLKEMKVFAQDCPRQGQDSSPDVGRDPEASHVAAPASGGKGPEKNPERAC